MEAKLEDSPCGRMAIRLRVRRPRSAAELGDTVKMNFNNSSCHRSLVVSALLVLTCGMASNAWCANLWASFDSGGGIESYTSKQIKKSGMPTPKSLSTFDNVSGLAFDKAHNLWAVVHDEEVVQFTKQQLKKLKSDPNPDPNVIITSGTFSDIIGCNFDHHGNLWVVDNAKHQLDELSKAQLAAGSADVTPAVVITDLSLVNPSFVTFDKTGNAWVDSENSDQIAEFTAGQLTTTSSQVPTVLLSDDGSGTSLDSPGQIAFDKRGNLWVPNYGADTVVEYAKGQLTNSGNPSPTVKLSSAIFDGPWGEAIDNKGNLAILNYNDGTIAKFAAKQLKVSGGPVPRVSVTGGPSDGYQIVFGPAT
jgi:hypothetical protein